LTDLGPAAQTQLKGQVAQIHKYFRLTGDMSKTSVLVTLQDSSSRITR